MSLFVILYVIVALVNYSPVQSLLGSYASDYFSREWGGKVKVGSIGCNPFDHLTLRNVELVSPDSDTICMADKIVCRFDGFPYDKEGLTLSYVYLRNVDYHLKSDSTGLNLNFIINHYKHPGPKKKAARPFKVLVDDLVLENVNYKQDLKEHPDSNREKYEGGVDIPHMEYRDINARFRNIRVDRDHITCRVDRMTAKEKSGLEVRRMTMNVYVSKEGMSVTNMLLETADSHLEGDVLLEYRDWKTMKYYVDSVKMTCRFEPGSWGSMRDASRWTKALQGMDQQAFIDGWFCGPVADLHADSVHIAFGDETTLSVDAYIYGLPGMDTTIIGADVHRLHTTYDDLAAVKHPRGITMKAPAIIRSLGTIDATASFTGTIADFYATLEMNSDMGDLKADLLLARLGKGGSYKYVGEVSSTGFSIGGVARNEWVSYSGFDFSVSGTGFDPKTMNANAEGRLHHTVIKGKRLQGEARINAEAAGGKVDAELDIKDPLADLTAHGGIQWTGDGGMSYTVEANIDTLNMKELGLWNDRDKDATVAATLHGTYRVVNEDRMLARAGIDNLRIHRRAEDGTATTYRMRNATLTAREQRKWKNITLSSDVMSATINGYFEYGGLGQMVRKFVADFLPGSVSGSNKDKKDERKDSGYDLIAGTDFEAEVEWNDSTDFLRAFLPGLYVARGSRLQMNYNFVESVKLLLRSDSLGWNNARITNVGLNGEQSGDCYRVRLTGDALETGEGRTVIANNADIRIESSPTGAAAHMRWDGIDDAIGDGDVTVRLVEDSSGARILFDNSNLALGGRRWDIVADGDGVSLKKGVLKVDRLVIGNDSSGIDMTARLGREIGNQTNVTVEGTENTDSERGGYVALAFNRFGADVLNSLISGSGMSMGGTFNGDVSMEGLGQMPYLNANLKADALVLNGEALGDAEVISTWNAELNQLNLFVRSRLEKGEDGSGTVQPLWIKGYVDLSEEDPSLDFDVAIEEVNLAVISPMVRSFSSDISGNAYVDMKIGGTLSHPEPQGFAVVEDGSVMVDFLNVRYLVSDTLFVDNGKVRLAKMNVRDELGGLAMVDGEIDISDMNDVRLNLKMHSDRLLCMNTTRRHSNYYYGRVVAEAQGGVYGPAKDLQIVLNARTLAGSSMYIPINDKRELKKADYIFFTDDEDFEITDIDENESDDSRTVVVAADKEARWNMTLDIETTPDLQMFLPLDYSSVTADLRAVGSGDIQIRIGSGTPFTIVGDYEMESGSMSLSMLSLLTKEFSIDPGSTITFPGAVSDVVLDVRAVYSQRVNMSSLTGTLSATESQKSITVESIIAVTGGLQSPTLAFDIRLPNADQSVEEEVFAYIDRTNERDMLNQTVSLLMRGKFYNASTSSVTTDQSIADQGYGIVASTLSSVVSGMVDFVDLNFEYRSGNALTTEQYALDISKEWNKFYFETTLGFGGEARELSGVTGNNNMTGDMLAGYKINPRLHLFVFNRSNTNDYTRSDLPYKQGVGLKYTRDFDRFSDLFKRKGKN